MRLSFNLENIKYLRLRYDDNGRKKHVQLALKEKKENELIAVSKLNHAKIVTPQTISIEFITNEGLYSTEAVLKEVKSDNEFTYYIISNPMTLDYQQNREHYRVLSEYDCIYTVETDDGVESYNSSTYDISAGGVSIIMDKIAISLEEMSIIIFMQDRDIKSHLEFVRCEIFEKSKYKLSFEFTDLTDKDYNFLTEMCLKKQLHQS